MAFFYLEAQGFCMKKEFFLNIIFLILANILIKPFYLLWVEVEVNNIVGPSSYGTYAGIFSLCYIFQIIADPGLLNFNTTQIAADRKKIYKQLPVMLGLKFTLAILYIVAIYIIAYFSGYGETQWNILPWIIGNILLISLNLFLRSNISAIGKYRWDSLFSILDKLLMIFILMYLIYWSENRAEFEILDFVKGQFLAYLMTFFVLLTFIGLHKISLIPSFDFLRFKALLRKSIPYAWLLFLMTIYTRVDSFMLERLMNDDGYQAGVYASAFRLFDAGNSFAYLFAVLLLPIFSNMLSHKQSIKPLLESAASFLFAGIVIVCVFGGLWSHEIMSQFYPEDYTEQYSSVFLLLMIALVPMALAYVTGSLLTADNRLKELNKMAVIGVFLNILLNLILIRNYEAEGTAFATAITQTTMTLIQLYFIFRFFNMSITLKQLLKYILFPILVFLLGFLLKEFSPLKSWVNFVVGIIICIVPALLLGLIRINFFKTMLKNRLSSE